MENKGQHKSCSSCGTVVSIDYAVCPKCHKVLFDNAAERKLIETLSNGLFKASWTAADSFQKELKNKGLESTDDDFLKMLYEYMCFFIHETSRVIFSLKGPEAKAKLLSKLIAVMAYSSSDVLFKGLDESQIEKKAKDFMSLVDMSELEYSERADLFDEKNPFTSNTRISLLVANIGNIYGEKHKNEIRILYPYILIDAIDHLTGLNLKDMNLN